MSDVFTLLALPQTSAAFTALPTSGTAIAEHGSASPPRKTARLDADSDSASASRSRVPPTESRGPVKVKVLGPQSEFY